MEIKGKGGDTFSEISGKIEESSNNLVNAIVGAVKEGDTGNKKIDRAMKEKAGMWIREAEDKRRAAEKVKRILQANNAAALQTLLRRKPVQNQFNALVARINAANAKLKAAYKKAVYAATGADEEGVSYPEKIGKYLASHQKAQQKAYEKMAQYMKISTEEARLRFPAMFTETTAQLEELRSAFDKAEKESAHFRAIPPKQRSANVWRDLSSLNAKQEAVRKLANRLFSVDIINPIPKSDTDNYFTKLQSRLNDYATLLTGKKELEGLMSRFKAPSKMMTNKMEGYDLGLKHVRESIEKEFGVKFKGEKLTDQFKRTILKSRWMFLTLSTITAIAVSRIIGYLMKLGHTLLALPWQALKRGVAAFYSLGKSVLFTRDKFRQYEIALNGVLASSTKAAQISKFAKEYAAKYPAMYSDIMKAFTLLAQNPQIKPFIKSADTKQLKEFMDIIQMLGKLNPEQGVAGARFAVSEAFAGNFRSLMMRFNLPAEVLAGTVGKTRKDLLDPKTLLEALKAYVKLNGGAQLLAASANNLSTHLGNLVDKWKMFLDVVGKSGAYKSALSFFKQLDELWGKFLASPVMNKLGDMLNQAIQNIMAFGKSLLKLFPEESFSSFDKFKAAMDNFIEAIGGTMDKLKTIFIDLYALLLRIMVPMFLKLGLEVGNLFAKGILKGLATGISNNKKSLLLGFAFPMVGIGLNSLKTFQSVFGAQPGGALESIYKDSVAELKKGLPKIIDDMQELLGLTKKTGEAVSKEIVGPFIDLEFEIEQIKTALKTLPANISNKVEGMSLRLQHEFSKFGPVNNKAIEDLAKHEILQQEPGFAAKIRQLDILQAVQGRALRMLHEFKKFGKVDVSEVVALARKEVQQEFENKPAPIKFTVSKDLYSNVQEGLSKAWGTISKNFLGAGKTPSSSDIKEVFTLSTKGTSEVVKQHAETIWARFLGGMKVGKEALKDAISSITGSFTSPLDSMRYTLQTLISELGNVPDKFKEKWGAGVVATIEKANKMMDDFNQKLQQQVSQLDSLQFSKFMVDINQKVTETGMLAQIAKVQGKPFDMFGILMKLGRQVAGEAVMASTPGGMQKYYEGAASLFQRAFGAAVSEKNVTKMQEAFDRWKRASTEAADIEKETLSSSIDKLTEAIDKQVKNYTEVSEKLIKAFEDAADKISGPRAEATLQKSADLTSAIRNTLYSYGAF